MNEIPFDKWTEIPNEKLKKREIVQIVYIPSKYPGPLAIDARVKENSNKTHQASPAIQENS